MQDFYKPAVLRASDMLNLIFKSEKGSCAAFYKISYGKE